MAVPHSKSRLELLHADVSRGMLQNNTLQRILEGNVHARQDSLELFCDRATYYEQQKKFVLTGTVRIVRGQDTLRANTVNYFEVSKVAIAEKQVYVNRPGQSLRCDYLEYYYKTDQARASGNVLVHDTEKRVFLSGEYGEYLPSQKMSYVEKKSHLWQLDSAATDTMHIYSRRMEYYFGDLRRAIAMDSVHIYQGALHATCDSAVYYLDDEVALLEKKPHAIQENNEIFGDVMRLKMHNFELQQIVVKGHAQAVSVEDSLLEKENKLEGREIIMYISNRKLQELWSISNARSFYYLKEGETDKGINAASADTIKAFFVRSELDSILIIGGAQGIYYPSDYKGPIRQE